MSSPTIPAEAPTTDLSGFTPNVEAIASYAPDLVVVSFDPEGLVASLTSLDIPVIQHDAAVTIDDTYTQIEQLGAATGHVAEAASLVGEMQTAIDELVATLPSSAQGHDLLPRARRHARLGDLGDVHRAALFAAGPGQHRRRV